MWVDGKVYHGMWKDGNQHGEGTMVDPNLKMVKSYWEKGKQISPLQISPKEEEEVLKGVLEIKKQSKEALKNQKRLHRASLQAARVSRTSS